MHLLFICWRLFWCTKPQRDEHRGVALRGGPQGHRDRGMRQRQRVFSFFHFSSLYEEHLPADAYGVEPQTRHSVLIQRMPLVEPLLAHCFGFVAFGAVWRERATFPTEWKGRLCFEQAIIILVVSPSFMAFIGQALS